METFEIFTNHLFRHWSGCARCIVTPRRSLLSERRLKISMKINYHKYFETLKFILDSHKYYKTSDLSNLEFKLAHPKNGNVVSVGLMVFFCKFIRNHRGIWPQLKVDNWSREGSSSFWRYRRPQIHRFRIVLWPHLKKNSTVNVGIISKLTRFDNFFRRFESY